MTDVDDLEAAWHAAHDALTADHWWEAVHDATPAARPTMLATRSLRRRLLMAAIGALVAACNLTPIAPPVPAGFLQTVGQQGMIFMTTEPLPEAVLPADALARIRRMQDPPPFVLQPPLEQPIFGMVSCIEQTRCEEGGHPNGIWLFQFRGPSAEDPVGWVAADGTAGGLWLSGDR